MKKTNFILIFASMLILMAIGASALTVTVTAPASSGIVNGTYNFTATLSAFADQQNVSNCTFATTADGVFGTAKLGNTTLYNLTVSTAGLTDTSSTTLTVSCYNHTNGVLLASGTSTSVKVDNSAPICSCQLEKSQIELLKPLSYGCSASTDYTTISTSCVSTYADATTETKTTATGQFENTNNLGQASVVCTLSDQAGHSTTCSTLTSNIVGRGGGEVSTPAGIQARNTNIVVIILVLVVALVAVFVVINMSKKGKKR